MKAIVYRKYGPPNVLELDEVEKPSPKDGEVRVKIKATTVSAVDSAFRQGNPFNARLYTGLFQPKNHVLGSAFSGTIELIGEGVTQFQVGDDVLNVIRVSRVDPDGDLRFWTVQGRAQ